jgi:magnesium transporter
VFQHAHQPSADLVVCLTGYAAQSLLAALGCIQFVSNVAFAYWVLKEKVTLVVIAATACIVAGCILLVIFGNHDSQPYNVKLLMELYTR